MQTDKKNNPVSSDLIPVDKLFLTENILKSVDKARDILESAKGEALEDKLKSIASKFSGLKIDGLKDQKNYEAVHQALLDLSKLRNAITKVGKAWRDNLTQQSKKELKEEKELLALFLGTEEELKKEKERIDELKKQEERKVLLPSRKKMLEDIKVEMSDEEILALDEKGFAALYEEKKQIFDEEEARKQREADEKKRQEDEIKKAREDAARQARKEAKEKAAAAHQAEVDKLTRERDKARQKIKDEAKKKREATIAQKKAEKNKKYQDFLKRNGWTRKTQDQFKVERDGDTILLYKRIDSITI